MKRKYVPADGCRNVWLKVTLDEYEYPLVIADSSAELAKLCGTTVGNIYSSMSHAKHDGRKSPYRKVRVEIDDD